jgi:hypothetical protein
MANRPATPPTAVSTPTPRVSPSNPQGQILPKTLGVFIPP